MSLGSDYRPDFDPAGWLVSEKMNGVRAFWDGCKFWTRSGNVIDAPAWLTADLPSVHLDGELWAGRGRFEESRQAVQLRRWMPAMRFTAFDAPNVCGAWRERLEAAGRAWHDVVTIEMCKGHGWLMDRLKVVQDGGGEGLVIRSPKEKRYRIGRGAFLKVKAWSPS